MPASPDSRDAHNWAERLVERLRRAPLLVLLFFGALLVSSLLTVGAAAVELVDRYHDRYSWRDDEYRKLSRLRAGTTLEHFSAVLGSPEFQLPVNEKIVARSFASEFTRNPYMESGFRGRGYWVQTLTNRDGTVIFFAVTACATDFKPTFYTPYDTHRIVLNQSTFSQVVPWRESQQRRHVESHYYASGATENSTFFDYMYGGNPLDYKTIVWGVNDACPDWYDRYRRMYDVGLLPFGPPTRKFGFKGDTHAGGDSVRKFRSSVRLNTYGETAPLASIDFLKMRWQPGVNRIVIRTLAPLEQS